MGIGMADVTTDRLVRQIDWAPTRVNAASASRPSRIRVPAHFASDRECLEWVAAMAGRVNASDVTFGWIQNTLELDRVAISPNVLTDVDGPSELDIEREIDAPWDEAGNLVSPFGL
jgi:hypothetical protein